MRSRRTRDVSRRCQRHGRIRAVILAFLTALLAVPGMRAQDQERPTFRSRVAVVPITAVVRDSRNRIVKDLRQDDFQVLEQGQPRRILDFSANADGPISVAVLFDTSGSMGFASNLMKGKDVVARVLERIQPHRDEVALFTFHKSLREQVPFTNNSARLHAALADVKPWGVTSLYDAVGEAAKRLSQRAGTRRALVVISDGLDTSSTLSSHEAAMLASAIDVPVYVIAVVSPLEDPAHKLSVVPSNSGGGLRQLAEFTGGDAYHVSAVDSSLTADALVNTLRHQYLFAIESSSMPGTYALQVVTNRRGDQVRSRRAYSTDGPVSGH